MKQYWIFTFGCGQNGAGTAVKIAGTYAEARAKMCEKYGNKWAFQYSEEEWNEYQKDTDFKCQLEEITEVSADAVQTCDDAVDRRMAINAAIEGADKWDGGFNLEREKCIQEEIEKLPSVTSQQKMGKWKAFTHSTYRGNDEDGEPIWREVTVYHCDLCNRRTVIKEKYCPNCGCKMQEDGE